MKLKKLIVAVASSVGRTIGELFTNSIPLRIPPPSTSGGASSGLIRPSRRAELRNVSASATIATGAESARTRRPAVLGPATYENARLPLRRELPSTKRSLGTIETNSDASATPKRTLRAPTANATMNSWAKPSASNAYATGTERSRSARPMSAAIIASRRRPRRSTQAPA